MPSIVPHESKIEVSRKLIEFIRPITRNISRILWRIELHGVENIPPENGRGVIIASNHQTYMDPFWITIPITREIRYLAWDEVFTWPIIGNLIRRMGAVPISITGGSALSTLRTTVKLLRDGLAVLIFPEGSREFADGKMLEFHPGAAQLAKLSKADILPVTIVGAHRIWPQGWYFPRPAKLAIHYHPIISAEEVKTILKNSDSENALLDTIRERIEDID